jgi:hypothetical protein
VTARQVAIIKTLVTAGAQLDEPNKDGLTPLQLAEKPDKGGGPPPDPDAYQPKRDSKEDVIAALRQLMALGPDDPAPDAPAEKLAALKKDEKKTDEKADEKKTDDTKPAEKKAEDAKPASAASGNRQGAQ